MKKLNRILLVGLVLVAENVKGSSRPADLCTQDNITDAQKPDAIKSCSSIANGIFSGASAKIKAVEKLEAWGEGQKFIGVVKSIATSMVARAREKIEAAKLWGKLRNKDKDKKPVINVVAPIAQNRKNPPDIRRKRN